MSISLLIAHISSLSVLIPLVLAAIQWKRLPDNIALLRWLLIVSAIADLTLYIMAVHLSMNNQLVADVYMFVLFTMLLYILWRSEWNRIFKIILVALYGISLIILESYAMSTSELKAFGSLVLIIVSIIFFYKLLKNELKLDNIHRLPILWIAFATLFYYSGNLFLFLAFNYLLNQTEYMGTLWVLHNFLNITKNIFFAVALWQSYRTMRSSV